MAYVIAIDAGTTSVRSALVDETGSIVDISNRKITSYFVHPGWVEQDPTQIWDAVVATLSDLIARVQDRHYPANTSGTRTTTSPSTTIAAIGITNQRETIVAFDRSNGKPLHKAIVWQDRRTALYSKHLIDQGLQPLFRTKTGLVLDPYFSATKIHWLLENGDLALPKSSPDLGFATIDAWILWNLSGGCNGGFFATEPSNASRTLLFDISEMKWSQELCSIFDIPIRSLPEVSTSCGRFAKVNCAQLGQATKALNAVPITGILGDQQAALFGQACLKPTMAKITYGTGSFVLRNMGRKMPDPVDGLLTTLAWDLGEYAGQGISQARNTNHAADTTARPDTDAQGSICYALEGSSFSSGAAIEWMIDGIGLIERAEALEPLALSVQDNGGVTFVPAFAGLGSPFWDPSARAIITGITRGTRKGHIARALLEGIAYQVRDMLDAMQAASDLPLSVLRADGGAAQMNLLLQLQANQIQSTISRPRSIESTVLGAAMLAGLGVGVWGNLDDLSLLWSKDVDFYPDIDAYGTAIAGTGDAASAGAHCDNWLEAIERSRGWAKA